MQPYKRVPQCYVPLIRGECYVYYMKKPYLNVGVVGVGYFGRFHALQAKRHKRENLVGVYDPNQQQAERISHEMETRTCSSYAALLEMADAIIIASPAETHYPLARQALEAGCHVLVEKPITATQEEGEELASFAETCGRVLQVGHLLRYSAEHKAITDRIQRPLYIEATRIAPYKVRGTDVSVVLDLMIHDLDLILSIVDSPILSIDAMGAAISSEYEDLANARIRFENGCVATIAASRVSVKTERKMRFFSQEGYLSADFMSRKLTFLNRHTGMMLPNSGGFRRQTVRWEEHDNLAAEHDSFVAACLDGARIVVDAQAGLRALNAALKVSEEIERSQEIVRQSGLIV